MTDQAVVDAGPQVARHAPPNTFNLVREVRAYHGAKPIGPRAHGIHPSSLASLCPVKFAIYEAARDNLASEDPQIAGDAWALVSRILNEPVHGVAPGGRFKAELLMEFRAGDNIHTNTQYDLGVIGKLWGKWECPQCLSTTEAGWMPRAWWPGVTGAPVLHAAPCVRCRGQNLRHRVPWHYQEPAVFHGHYGIVGHYDGDVRIVRGEWEWRCLLEIKSINENGYFEKYGSLPRAEHVVQASVYAWLAGFSWIMFVYVDKNALHKWKEIVVPVDQDAIAEVVNKLEAVKMYRDSKQLPVHARLCEDIQCERARGCPVAAECWGRPPEKVF